MPRRDRIHQPSPPAWWSLPGCKTHVQEGKWLHRTYPEALSNSDYHTKGYCIQHTTIIHKSWLRFVHTSQISHKFQTFRQPSATFVSEWLTDEGSRRLPKHLNLGLLASVNEPQSCQNYLATHTCSYINLEVYIQGQYRLSSRSCTINISPSASSYTSPTSPKEVSKQKLPHLSSCDQKLLVH